MSKIKKILISAVISLVVVLIASLGIKLVENKNILAIPIVTNKIEEGGSLEHVSYIEVKLKNITKDVLENIVSKDKLEDYVANNTLQKGEILLKNKLCLK